MRLDLPALAAPLAAALSLVLLTAPLSPGDTARVNSETVQANDNRRPAGLLRNGVLTVRLEARNGFWEPGDSHGSRLPVAAFAETGRPLTTPGPLLRVPVGTEVRATIRNRLEAPMWLHGMGATRGVAGDSVLIEPGATREVRFRATAAGLFYYAARLTPRPLIARNTMDSQLNGVIVVDPAGAPPPPDRIYVISSWFTIDTTSVSGLGPNPTLAMNGKHWPHTQRIDATQGDTLRFRLVNLTPLEHPMHLHGFYFRLDARGDGARDTVYAPEARRLAVTEPVFPLQTMSITWSPERSGNWIFHCHFPSHIATFAQLHSDRRMPVRPTVALASHSAHPGGESRMTDHMSGLVIGIRVRPRGPAAVSTGTPRNIRLIVRSRAKVYGEYVGYSYVLGGSPAEAVPDSLPIPGPTLVLTKGEPVAVTIVNTSHDEAAVHWHGIELESFPDGVPGWSGSGNTTLPMIAPGDSLTVRFTPPRAGTFMYHSHSNEFQQIASGLYGAIIVVDRGTMPDPARDKVLLFSDGGPTVFLLGNYPPTLVNGKRDADSITLQADVPTRLRLINIRTDFILDLALLDGDRLAKWRLVAKDGAALPATQLRDGEAKLMISPGEIYDVLVTARAGSALTFTHQVRGDSAAVRIPVGVQ